VETKTDDMYEIELPGYIFHIKNRKTNSKVKSGGGIIIGYQEQFHKNIEVIETECKFALWCKISKLICSEAVIWGIVYIPPEYTSYSSPDAFGQIENEYMQLITNHKNVVLVEVLKKGRVHNLSIKCQYDLFDKMVNPILLYGCEIWVLVIMI